ncbi:MAG: 2-hydroxyacyl-CoA dehydratase family protein [Thermodesulfobacteriota bacterium]
MRKLLALCGYEAHEMEMELLRVQKVFTKLGITDEDILVGKQRLATYFDMELKGVRKLFGLFLRELVDITLAKEEGKKKVIHGCMAPSFEILGSALRSNSKDVCVLVPNPPFMVVLGFIFDKFVSILEAAEEQWLKSGLVSHCAMVKTRLGLFALNLVPRPDLLVTSGSLCETSPKTNDLLHEFYDIPTYCYDTVQDRELWEYPDSSRAIQLSAKGLRRMVQRVQEEVGFEITDDMLREVLRVKGSYAAAVNKVHELIQKSDPVPIGSTHDNLLMWLSPVPLSIDNLSAATDAVNMLYKELQERVGRGVGAVEKGAPKIFSILPFHHTDPRLEHLVNQIGMAIVATDMEFTTASGMSASSAEPPKDPYEAMSQYLQSALLLPLGGRISIILDACKRLNVDGVLNHYHVGCRSVAGDALIIKDAITKELKIPVLLLEWENFDPRVYDHEQYKTMLEVFRSMIRTGR